MSTTQTVAETVADELGRAGIDRVFGLPGGEVLVRMDGLRRRGISFELCRHEASAAFAAAVYGKIKGVPGVVLTTLGPGAANLLLPIANSWLDREPLVAITADIPTSWPGQHTHQRLKLKEIYGPVVKSAEAVNQLNARSAVRRAVTLANQEPHGPAFLTLSAEDAIATTPAVIVESEQDHTRPEPATGLVSNIAAALAGRLAAAERPLVLVGLGTRPEHAAVLRQWLGAWNLPVAVTPKVKGIVDETDSRFVGVVGGMSIDQVMVDALRQSDLIVGVGFDPTEVDKRWHTELPILWVLESPQATGISPNGEVIVTPHGALLASLSTVAPPRVWADTFAGTREQRQRTMRGDNRPAASAGSVEPTALVRALVDAMPADTIVTTDVGSHKYLFGQFWPSREPLTFFMSNGLSGMGYGLPAAIGAKLARPEAAVLAVLGDGGFSMSSQELETARRLGAAIITVVLADASYSLIRHSQAGRGLPNYGVDFMPIDSVLTARACGVDGIRATSTAEITDAVRKAVAAEQSLLVEVPIDPDAWSGLV